MKTFLERALAVHYADGFEAASLPLPGAQCRCERYTPQRLYAEGWSLREPYNLNRLILWDVRDGQRYTLRAGCTFGTVFKTFEKESGYISLDLAFHERNPIQWVMLDPEAAENRGQSGTKDLPWDFVSPFFHWRNGYLNVSHDGFLRS